MMIQVTYITPYNYGSNLTKPKKFSRLFNKGTRVSRKSKEIYVNFIFSYFLFWTYLKAIKTFSPFSEILPKTAFRQRKHLQKVMLNGLGDTL